MPRKGIKLNTLSCADLEEMQRRINEVLPHASHDLRIEYMGHLLSIQTIFAVRHHDHDMNVVKCYFCDQPAKLDQIIDEAEIEQ